MTAEPDTEMAAIIDHINTEHDDAVAIVAQAHAGDGVDAFDGAEVVALAPDAMTLRVHSAGVDHDVVAGFSEPVADADELFGRMLALVAESRRRLGIEKLTSAELQVPELAGIRTFVTSVAGVERLSPRFRQLTFAGGDLGAYVPGGPDQFLYLLLPPPGRGELTIDASFTWEAFDRMASDDRPIGAYYTVRRWRPDVAELDIVCFLHGDGRASSWAATAEPGARAALWGPRTAYAPPADTDWVLLAGDETGIPAIAAILEELPDGMPAQVFVEGDGDADRLPLPARPGVAVRWLDRRGAEPGTTTLLVDAVRQLDLPAGNPYAWGGAESRAVTAIRNHLRHTVGVDRHRVSMTGYWRHTTGPGKTAK